MLDTGIVGDPACTMAIGGWADADTLVTERMTGKRIGIGRAGEYTCLIY